MSNPIESYALIGDGASAALVGRDGSIDWLCWPRFDDDACFCALLGTPENGHWRIAPVDGGGKIQRRYRGDTLVIETTTRTAAGTVRITDFMPVRALVPEGTAALVRVVEGLSGAVPMDFELRLRFDYGALPPRCEVVDGGFVALAGPARITLRGSVPVQMRDAAARAAFTLREGERQTFVLNYASATAGDPPTVDPDAALAATVHHWESWIGRFDASRTHWPAAVKRSLLTLKAMVHHRSGGLVAAPTAGLPEVPAGKANWDYRYCWLRDATFTLGAFLNAGYHDEAVAWRDWLLRAVADAPEELRIMYRVDGSRQIAEWTVDDLPGYRAARPVRIGNAAATQTQLDVYGEVLDCFALARRAGIAVTPHQRDVEQRVARHLSKVWMRRDSGIWESRGEPRPYTYSKAMAWVGIDRAARVARQDGPGERTGEGDVADELAAVAKRIHAEVCSEAFVPSLDTFTQSYGSHALDGSLLLLPLVGFLPPDDPRIVATVARIERELGQDGFIRRQRIKADDTDEGAFLPCSLWMADCLRLQAKPDEAAAYLERVLGVANDVGLLSEEYDVPTRSLAGNFPQALTHLAVVNTALGLSGPVLDRGGG